MKKTFWALCAVVSLLFSCAGTQSSDDSPILSLDDAIWVAGMQMERSLPQGTKVALLNFTSPTEEFSEYVLEELSNMLVFSGKLVVLDRHNLDLIRQEERFQLSGEVSDESAQAIGRKLGAQMIMSGSLTSTGKTYRFRTKTLVVETAVVIESFSVDINSKENKTVSLLSGGRVSTETTPASARNKEQGEYDEYTILLSGTNKGVITVKRETDGRIVITPNITERGIFIPIDNSICPLIPPGEEFYAAPETRSIVINVNTHIKTNSDDSWSKTVVQGNTTTVTDSGGWWSKTVVQGNTKTTTFSDGVWSKTVVQENTKTITWSNGKWTKIVVQGNTTTKTWSDGSWTKTVIDKQGNTISIHTEEGE